MKSLGPALLIGLLSSGTSTALAQTSTTPHFDVASIKPMGPLQQQISSGNFVMRPPVMTDTRVDLNNLSLADLIALAYHLEPYQLTSPDWTRIERYDLQATLPAGAKQEQVPQMLQTLLAERFKVTLHREKKAVPAYALIVGKGGHKLKPSASQQPPTPTEVEDSMRMHTDADGFRMEFDKATMADFAEMLNGFLDKPVMDQTGLTGYYRVQLEMSKDDLMAMTMAKAAAEGVALPPGILGDTPGQATTPSSGSSIFTTVQKLGLKLELRTLPVDMLVIDSAEKTPTEN